jgi:hypothetical protein
LKNLVEKTKPIVSFCVLSAADCEFEKQSQFTGGQIGVTLYLKVSYEYFCGLRQLKTKPIQSLP